MSKRVTEEHRMVEQAFMRDMRDVSALADAFDAVRLLADVDFDAAHEWNKRIKNLAGQYAKEQQSVGMLDIYKRSLLFDAPYDFDSYLLYTEWNREPKSKFYPARRRQLLPAVQQMQRLANREIKLLAISMPPGVGKALANETPILTRHGWKTHGELVVGDEVIGMDGEFKKVIAVHPKCSLDVLVEFTNGEKIQCHENHEWKVYDRSSGKEYTAETKVLERQKLELGTDGTRGHRYVIQIPKHEYFAGEEKKLPLSPYVLGVWLGDGANRNPRIANAKGDYAIIQHIIELGYPVRWSAEHKQTGVMYYDFDIRKELQALGMCHSRETTEKHIPDEYITASIDQRLELLAGLLDTDGSLCKRKYLYSTTSEALSDGVAALISTFGWRTCVCAYKPQTSSSGITGRSTCYVVSFTPDCVIPCKLSRKRSVDVRRQRRIAIKSITRVTPKEGNCITVEGDGMYLAGRALIPTHNTTLALFYLTWLAGREPEKPILTGSHNNDFLNGAYNECLQMIKQNGEYLWSDVFPECRITNTNAKSMMLDLGHLVVQRKRFATLEFTSVGSGNAGKVRAQNLLYCDDLVSDITQAMSRDQLDKLWTQYTTDLRQRKIGDCVELHIATRWSVHDVIGRLERAYGDNSEAEFLIMPAMDENDESNFDYANGVGFSTQMYREQREIMDDINWKALFMNEPIEREGQLYPEAELRRYFELPSDEPDAILSVCDTKDRGKDYCVMPIVYQYGTDFYVEECICDNSAPETVEARLVSALVKHRVKMSRFESNSAGGRIAEKVQRGVKEHGGITRITTKFTTQNKETKIIVNAPWVKEHCLFKDNSVTKGNREYRKMLGFLTGYTMLGRNAHDDVVDAFAMLAEYIESLEGNIVRVFKRPF